MTIFKYDHWMKTRGAFYTPVLIKIWLNKVLHTIVECWILKYRERAILLAPP